MTLILTALCKNGICVCADKRERTLHKNGLVEVRDDLYKIHKFISIPLIIYNHGVNKFINKTWKVLCSDYESSNRWDDKNLKQISKDFKSFIEINVKKQLESNLRNFPGDENLRASFFNLCGKDEQNNRFGMFELHWSIDSKGSHFKNNPHRAIVRSGDGKKYLDNYMSSRREINTIDYWERMNTAQAKNELRNLFSVAVEERKRKNGNEFSDSCDIECIG